MAALEQGTIFCSHRDYKGKAVPEPVWSVFMMGHGLIGESIVYLALNDFNKVLAFLDRKISTRLLVYSSCFASGLNAKILYASERSSLQQSYSFAIIARALTDAPTIGSSDSNYADFFKEITNSNAIDFKRAMYFLLAQSDLLDISNLAQIKLPGCEWFSMLDMDAAVSITPLLLLAKAGDEVKPLDVVAHFKKRNKVSKLESPKAILLYVPEVACELKIDSDKVRLIVSMIAGDAVHSIKKISSSVVTVARILDWFQPLYHLAAKKEFLIGEIQGTDYNLKKVLISYRKQDNDDVRWKIYCMDDTEKVYVQERITNMDGKTELIGEVSEASTNDASFYQNRLATILLNGKDISSLDSFRCSQSLYLPVCCTPDFPNKSANSYVINEMSGNDAVCVDNIIEFLYGRITFPGIYLIKKINGRYGVKKNGSQEFEEPELICIPSTPLDAFVTLENVFIQGGGYGRGRLSQDLFFTCNGIAYQGMNRTDQDYMDLYEQRIAELRNPGALLMRQVSQQQVIALKAVLRNQLKEGPRVPENLLPFKRVVAWQMALDTAHKILIDAPIQDYAVATK